MLAARVRVSGSSAAITGAFHEPEAEQLEALSGAGATRLQLSLRRRDTVFSVHQDPSSGFAREVLYIDPSTNGSRRGCKEA